MLFGCVAWVFALGCGPSAPGTPLHAAVQDGNYPAVRQHIAARSDLNAKNAAGWTALHVAAMKGDLQMVKLLAEGGADVRRPGPLGRTPVDVAREKGKTPIVQYLEARLQAEPAKAGREKGGRRLIDGGLGVSDVLDNY
jgi:ankyrin repeat protein